MPGGKEKSPYRMLHSDPQPIDFLNRLRPGTLNTEVNFQRTIEASGRILIALQFSLSSLLPFSGTLT